MAAQKMTKNQMRRAKKKDQKKAQAAATPDGNLGDDSQADHDADAAAQVGSGEQAAANGASPSSKELEVKKDPNATNRLAADGPTNAQAAASELSSSSSYALLAAQVASALDETDPTFSMFRDVFSKFGARSLLEGDEVAREANAGNKGVPFFDQDDDIPSEDEEATQTTKLSKKKRKKLMKLSIAELKALVAHPEVVEWHDVSSSDPPLLVKIKAQRNMVPVPSHWMLKREYLSSKRGIEKPPFKLPKFVAETGITEMRDAVLEKQAEQTLKQKMRERVQPKMGKLDIDYQKLYDAFFRHQSKPDLTRFGDVYYEGKEWEADYRGFKPGEMSEPLREALGMSLGFPPPWLLQQQRVGPPPSYPTLKIPGLNAPLPPGASWGFQPGQWGKPPLDEYNRPLYGGDIFGIMAAQQQPPQQPQMVQPGMPYQQQPVPQPQTIPQAPDAQVPVGEPIDRTLWGELRPPAEESEDEDEDEEEDDEDEDADAGDLPPDAVGSGLETPGGYASTVITDHPSGVETSMASEFDLRKSGHGRRGYETEEHAGAPRAAYQVIPERQGRAEGFFGSDKTYDLSRGGQPQQQHPLAPPPVPLRHPPAGARVLGGQGDEDTDAGRKRKKPGDVDVALDPDALAARGAIGKDELQRQYEAGRRQEGPGAQWAAARTEYDQDLSDMIAQESRKRQKRDEERRGGAGKR